MLICAWDASYWATVLLCIFQVVRELKRTVYKPKMAVLVSDCCQQWTVHWASRAPSRELAVLPRHLNLQADCCISNLQLSITLQEVPVTRQIFN
jgi:hypothetical protein